MGEWEKTWLMGFPASQHSFPGAQKSLGERLEQILQDDLSSPAGSGWVITGHSSCRVLFPLPRYCQRASTVSKAVSLAPLLCSDRWWEGGRGRCCRDGLEPRTPPTAEASVPPQLSSQAPANCAVAELLQTSGRRRTWAWIPASETHVAGICQAKAHKCSDFWPPQYIPGSASETWSH